MTADIDIPLTEREGQVLRQMVNGLTNKEIAEVLHIGYETIREHIKQIHRKIGVKDRTQAAVWAVRKGLA
jgi:DNA-binding NarL/FixJ family response regulator